MSEETRIRVLAFGSVVEVLGWASQEVVLGGEKRLSALIEQLERAAPRLVEARDRLRFAVNQQYATPETPLNPGDEVAIIPPVSGGDHPQEPRVRPPIARLVREPIDVPALAREVEDAGVVGAIATFTGLVRYETNAGHKPLRVLEYTAYEPMALAEMRRLCESIVEKHRVNKALLVHRLGTLKIGEVSVAAIVSSPHREEAFDACRALIEGLKHSVPIFKREHWQDGQRTWVDGV